MSTRRRVLCARLDNMGDVLLTGPAVRAVAAEAAETVYLAGPGGAAAAGLLPGVAHVLTFDAPWVSFRPTGVDARAIDRFVACVRDLGVDEAIVFTSSHQSPLPLALLLRLAGVPAIGAYSRDYAGTLLDVRLRSAGDVHEVVRALELVRACGFGATSGTDLRVDLGPDPGIQPFDAPYVVVHAGASVPARAIPPALARAAVRALVTAGWNVALTGRDGEADAARSLAEACDGDRVRVVDGSTSLRAFATVLRDAHAVVCGNTGPAHLAAAVGTPVVSVFAPVVPLARWRPWGVPNVVLGDQGVVCAGCRSRVCAIDGQPCVGEIDADAVVDAVAAIARGRATTGTVSTREVCR